jgi:Tc5 transposase DNA-binding domain
MHRYFTRVKLLGTAMTRALSKLKLRYQTSQGKEKLIHAAVELFHKSRNEAILNNQKVPSYIEIARICNVPRETLRRRIAQLPSRLEAAATRGWLNHVETQQLIDHILRCADLGFPHGRKEIECHALELARVRHPDLAALGSGWVDRFVARNHDQLRVHWTSNLDHSRAAGVNPTAVAHWFRLVGSAFQEYEFAHENIYGFDESGFPFGGDGSKQRVIGQTDASIQHVQRGGNRENVTVMVTICADGTTTRPTVIFKGKKMFSDWTRSNVANMRHVKSTHTLCFKLTHKRRV